MEGAAFFAEDSGDAAVAALATTSGAPCIAPEPGLGAGDSVSTERTGAAAGCAEGSVAGRAVAGGDGACVDGVCAESKVRFEIKQQVEMSALRIRVVWQASPNRPPNGKPFPEERGRQRLRPQGVFRRLGAFFANPA